MAFDMARARDHLSPFVGKALAEMCIRTTAIGLGKTTDGLVPSDLPHLEREVSRLLRGMATQEQVDRVVREMGACF